MWYKQIRDHHDSVPTFEKKELLSGSSFHNFAAVDWNRDGFMDLLVCSGGMVRVMMNGGYDGQDSFGSTHEIAGNVSRCNFLKGLDFDSDGDVDLIVDTRYFERIGENSLEERTGAKNPLQIVAVGKQISFQKENELWAVEDWDNDGDVDLLITRRINFDQYTRHLFLIEQLSDGTFREAVENPFSGIKWTFSKYIYPGRIYLADLDGDGLMDLWQVQQQRDGRRCDHVSEHPHVRDQVLAVENHISRNPTNHFQDLYFLGDEFHRVDWNEDGLMDFVSSRTRCNGVYNQVSRAAEPAIRYFQGQEDGSLRENRGVFEDVDGGRSAFPQFVERLNR